MGSMFMFNGLFASLHEAATWVLGRRPQRPSPALPAPPVAERPIIVPAVARQRNVPAVRQAHRAPARRPVRVVCVSDAGSRRAHGRMVISGRMADVCAELERLAALEAAAN